MKKLGQYLVLLATLCVIEDIILLNFLFLCLFPVLTLSFNTVAHLSLILINLGYLLSFAIVKFKFDDVRGLYILNLIRKNFYKLPVLLKQNKNGICNDVHIQQATTNEYRTTHIGNVLRKTRHDKLPQINVLRGDISNFCVQLKDFSIFQHSSNLSALPDKKLLIHTINAHSYNIAQKDASFAEALAKCDVLIPDGASIVKAVKWFKGASIERIAGWDLFVYEMGKLNKKGGTCFFLGSSEKVLKLIRERAATDYPNIQVITYSPPYKDEFTEEENAAMIQAINAANPDLLWIGMTAPKQEKWAYKHLQQLDVNCHIGAIGAVFDFYAGTVERAPLWWQGYNLEWLFRLIKEPRRMWKRYIIGNFLFVYYIFKEEFNLYNSFN